MTIARIGKIRDLAVFDNYAPIAAETDFCKFNLIYGFNGSGKTTLSRLFSSLERGLYCKDLPVGGRFEIALDGGATIAHDTNLDRLKGKIAVFNEDFVEANFRWREGSANPVFYLGEEQAGLAEQLRITQEKLEPSRTILDQRKRERTKAETSFANFKRDTARNIAEQFGLGRSYVATQLDRDYSAKNEHSKLGENEQNELRSILAQVASKPKIVLLEIADFDNAAFLERVSACLEASVGSVALKEFQGHEVMLPWAKEGLDYHRDHKLDACLFCGNDLTHERLVILDSAIDDRLERIGAEAEQLLADAHTRYNALLSLAALLPSENDISSDQTALVQHRTILEVGIATAGKVFPPMTALLERKSRRPNTKISLPTDTLPLTEFLEQKKWFEAVEAINRLLGDHNEATDKFEERRKSALDRLKEHYLSLAEGRYRELARSHTNAEIAAEASAKDAASIEASILNLRGKLLQHGPAAAAINALVKAYLRHGNIEVVAASTDVDRGEGFQIRRNGSDIVGVLSEGEKTAIALCYFISTLQAEGRNIKDLIIVVDDPISSLDTKALNYAFILLRSYLTGAKQVFLLTHNINFMQECRKWLLNMSKKDPPIASLLFIELSQDGDGKRTSRIGKLPKLLRDYESEYHYLFQHLKKFSLSEGLAYDYFYLMPNAMRKILDIFLAFKLPGPDGLKSKVERLASLLPNFDGNRLMAIDRLIQSESHADNLDDLVSFSSMTIEEARECALAILALMAEMDKPHHDRLTELCA